MNGKDKEWFIEYLDERFQRIEDRVTNNHSKLITLYQDTLKPMIDKHERYIEKDKKFKYGIIGGASVVSFGIGLLLAVWKKLF